MREAIERAPRDFELYLALSRLQFSQGDLSESLRSARRARKLNPLDPLFDEDYPSSG